MRKSINIIVLAFVASFTTTNVVAQNGETSVSIGAGRFFSGELTSSSTTSFFGTSTTTQTSKFAPMLSVKLERQFGKRLCLGVGYSALSASTDKVTNSSGFTLIFATGPSTTREKIESKISGLTFNLKGILYADSAFQGYVGFGGLKTLDNISSTTSGANTATGLSAEQKTEQSATAFIDLNVGMRYFIAKNVGLYVEIGSTSANNLSGVAGQVGIICRF
jgi:hypothetical protein